MKKKVLTKINRRLLEHNIKQAILRVLNENNEQEFPEDDYASHQAELEAVKSELEQIQSKYEGKGYQFASLMYFLLRKGIDPLSFNMDDVEIAKRSPTGASRTMEIILRQPEVGQQFQEFVQNDWPIYLEKKEKESALEADVSYTTTPLGPGSYSGTTVKTFRGKPVPGSTTSGPYGKYN